MDRDAPGVGVHLEPADELELEPVTCGEVADMNPLTNVDTAVPRLRLDEPCRTESLFEQCDPVFEQRLLFACVHVVAVLRAVRLIRCGLPESLGDAVPLDRRQALELVAQPREPFPGDDRVLHCMLLSQMTPGASPQRLQAAIGSGDHLAVYACPAGAMHLELRHLRYFLAVAEELNFTRAAERLHIAQPALSAQIRSLEKQVGSELFVRTTRKVELTPAGELLLEDAREIVRRADEALAKLAALARGQRGVLRVGFLGHGAGEASTEILRRFAAEFPSFEVDLVESRTLEGAQGQVVERDTDAAFVWLPILHEELEVEPIASERKLVAMHPEHPLSSKRAIDPDDLVEEPIVAPWHRYTRETTTAWLGPFRDARRDFDCFAESIDECMGFVSRGLAVFCVPESVERFYGRPDVVFRPLLGVEPAGIVLVWHRESESPAVASFVEITRQVVRAGAETPVSIQSRRR